MLEGLEISILSKKELEFDNLTKRFDSEFLKKEFLKNISTIKNYPKGFRELNFYIEHLSGGATPLGADYETMGVPFLRVQNIMQNYFSLNEVVYLNKQQDNDIKRSRLKEKDVLLTITGVSYGKSAVVPKSLVNANINQHSVKITLNDGLNPYFLSTFLNCKYGKLQSDKNIVGVTRPALDYNVIRNFKIPCIEMGFQIMIEKLILESEDYTNEANSQYEIANNILLEKLDLKNWNPTSNNTNKKTLKQSFLESGRLDAEYYQPKYDELEKHLFKTGNAIRLGTHLLMNKRGTQPIYIDSTNGIPVLNSKHIRENRIEFSDNRFGFANGKNTELIIKKYDILMNGTGVGTIGRSAVYMKDEPALPDNHVTILRVDEIDPIFLSVQLNSIIGKLQVEKYFKGSSGQIELYPTDIDEFVIWKAPNNIQLEIRALIIQSETIRHKSEYLLSVANDAVELAIENNIYEAIQYINSKTN